MRYFGFKTDNDLVIEYLEMLPKGTMSKAIVDSIELSIYDMDKSFIFKEKEYHELKIKELDKVIVWKEARDKVRLEKLWTIQIGDKIKKWVDWYNERAKKDKKKAGEWLKLVLNDIISEIDFPITEEEFIMVAKGKVKLEVDK